MHFSTVVKIFPLEENVCAYNFSCGNCNGMLVNTMTESLANDGIFPPPLENLHHDLFLSLSLLPTIHKRV